MSGDNDSDMILDAVDRFCRDRLSGEEVLRRDREHVPPYDLIAPMAEMGLLRVSLPEQHGGLGLGWTMLFRIQERIGYHANFVASIISRIVNFGAMPVILFGTPRQRDEILPQILEGRLLVALALTEPGAGSDARGIATRAQRVRNGWKITGRKTWISDADAANFLLTLCRVRGKDDQKDALTAFLVPRQSAGLHMTALPKVGNWCMPCFDIGFDDVLIGDEYRLGEIGAGFETVTGTLQYSRASQAATVVGMAQAALDTAMAHAKQRIQFARPLTQFQVIRHRLVDMHMEVSKARLLLYELARRIDAMEPTGEWSAMAKITATDALQYVTTHGMQILASAGYSADSRMQRYWRDGRLFTFGEGSNEIQREIIARQIGLY